MPKEITVKVNHNHILDGTIESMHCCPIALACEDVIRDEFPEWNDEDYEMCVDMGADIYLRDRNDNCTIYNFTLSHEDQENCERFIDRFDNQNEYYSSQEDRDQNLQPFEFTAKLIEER
tara:strand:+ start:773 stop:1129 length:357 start_codon:yes stop_codon:yes gene_type:complete